MPTSTPTPVVIVCHERYGVVQHTVELTEKFAAAGFVAVAPDFYADMDLSGEHDRLPDIGDAAALRHLDAAIAYARNLDPSVGGAPVAVVGICRTGSYGILASAERDDIAAAVMLYGGAQPREYEVGDLRSDALSRTDRCGHGAGARDLGREGPHDVGQGRPPGPRSSRRRPPQL